MHEHVTVLILPIDSKSIIDEMDLSEGVPWWTRMNVDPGFLLFPSHGWQL